MGAQFRCAVSLLNFIMLLLKAKHEGYISSRGTSVVRDVDISTAFASQSPRMLCINRNRLVFSVLLLLCGDILPNPGPASVKYPCTVCSKSVSYSQKGIECSRCDRWTHALCAKVTYEDYAMLSADVTIEWRCPDCAVISDLPFANYSLSSSISDFSVHDGVHSPSPASLHQPLSCTCFNASK